MPSPSRVNSPSVSSTRLLCWVQALMKYLAATTSAYNPVPRRSAQFVASAVGPLNASMLSASGVRNAQRDFPSI